MDSICTTPATALVLLRMSCPLEFEFDEFMVKERKDISNILWDIFHVSIFLVMTTFIFSLLIDPIEWGMRPVWPLPQPSTYIAEVLYAWTDFLLNLIFSMFGLIGLIISVTSSVLARYNTELVQERSISHRSKNLWRVVI
jgi:hypothetical protein